MTHAPPDVAIRRIRELPTDVSALVRASEGEGFAHLRRLVVEWKQGSNRFDQDGEALFEARLRSGELVGVCGLNRDPHTPDCSRFGRVRRLYVAPSMRRQGIASQLVHTIQTAAEGQFDALGLRTHDRNAAAFYEALGFASVADVPHRTHRLSLR